MITININNKNSFKIILKHVNILYIEDEELIRENITKTLKLIVSNVYSVKNIIEAKEKFNLKRIDLIISDINLGENSGLEFIKTLRNDEYDIPIILLSAFTNKEYLLEATKLKLVDYLVKPIDFDTLNNALHNAAKEIVKKGKFILDFEDNISYNVMQKKLYSKTQGEIDISTKEIKLLEYFIENHSKAISHEEIKNHLWDDPMEASDSALKNVLNKLRKKIGKDTIKNISGIGFRIKLH